MLSLFSFSAYYTDNRVYSGESIALAIATRAVYSDFIIMLDRNPQKKRLIFTKLVLNVAV